MTFHNEARFIGNSVGLAIILVCLFGCDFTRSPDAEVQPADRATPSLDVPSETLEEQDGRLGILAWNIESGGNDPQVIAGQLREFSAYDVICLNEVGSDNFQLYKEALQPKFQGRLSETGRSDRLAIFWDDAQFELLEVKELMDHNGNTLNNGTHRSPMYVRLKERDSDLSFIVMTNHLARGNAELRKEQAIGLREWARDQAAPIINIGDFNMDFKFQTKRGTTPLPRFCAITFSVGFAQIR